MKVKIGNRFFWVKVGAVGLDLFSVSLLYVSMVFIRLWLGGEFEPWSYLKLYPFLFVFWIVFEKAGLYQGCAIYSGASIGPVEEIRRIFYATSMIFIGLGFANYIYHPDNYLYSRSILLASYLGCLVLIPANRLFLRKVLASRGWWGVSTVIIGSGKIASSIYQQLSGHSEYGLLPVGYFSDHAESEIHMPPGATHLGAMDRIHSISAELSIKYAIIAEDNVDSSYISAIVKQYGVDFPHLLFVPCLGIEETAWVSPKDISGTLGLEIRHNLLIPNIYRLKRILDYALTIPCTVVGTVVMAVIALLIKLDSPGPVIFKHSRIAKNGRKINIYKFRTMVLDAPGKLEQLLASDPALRVQWETFGKLDDDPRITRIGRWLRKTSLDELPQLFNVLQGKLALVGPRPIIEDELRHYGENADVFDMVLPGITGLWQVSGRNELSYEDRVRLDKYYVNNWSVWLDVYILSKTFFAVVFRSGAR
jgi:Undecaprenyl-phosphate galactose phosphotransferase WbaP